MYKNRIPAFLLTTRNPFAFCALFQIPMLALLDAIWDQYIDPEVTIDRKPIKPKLIVKESLLEQDFLFFLCSLFNQKETFEPNISGCKENCLTQRYQRSPWIKFYI